MGDSNVREDLEAKHERDREQRIEAIKRWVDYIRSNPPEVWGPQQNTVVDDQLEAASQSEMSASARQRVTDVAAEIIEKQDDSDDESG